MKFTTTRTVEVEALSFNDLVGIGIEWCREQGVALVNGMPWWFTYAGQPVSHERDDCYLIGAGLQQLRFTRGGMLVNDGGRLEAIEGAEFSKRFTYAGPMPEPVLLGVDMASQPDMTAFAMVARKAPPKLQVSPELLLDALFKGGAKGVSIVGASFDFRRQVVELEVDGPDLPKAERIVAEVTTTAPAVRFRPW